MPWTFFFASKLVKHFEADERFSPSKIAEHERLASSLTFLPTDGFYGGNIVQK